MKNKLFYVDNKIIIDFGFRGISTIIEALVSVMITPTSASIILYIPLNII